MSWITIVAWVFGIAAFIGLIITAHRGASPPMRLILVLINTAALIILFTDQPFGLVLYLVDILLVLGTWRFSRTRGWKLWIGVIVLTLILSKMPSALTGNDLTIPLNFSFFAWLGFSYLAFRLIHVTVDAHQGRLGDPTLEELLIYALHPASFISGPIDRIQKSVASQRNPAPFTEDLHQGLWRILIGAFRKFVIANTLFAFIVQHNMAENPDQPIHVAWLWLIAFSFYLLADFASYTDLAIGFGQLAGITLPENFDRPYQSPSISLFWQRWHMTLSFWLRDYIFFPLARELRSKAGNRYRAVIQFICHMTTMGIAGLWHGLTPAFLLWGLWHGFGLFVNGQFAAAGGTRKPAAEVTWGSTTASILATYLFVTLGWVLFTADLPTAIRIYARLFGIQ
jgi:alginate O-acetyltransferase complex protein AlgI